MFSKQQKLGKFFLFTGTLLFFLVGFLGFSHFSMTTEFYGKMSDCPFMGVIALCQMTPLEHLASWQTMFKTLPYQQKGIFFVLILFIILFSLSWLGIFILKKDLLEYRFQFISRFHNATFRTALEEAFSNGIVHPKIF